MAKTNDLFKKLRSEKAMRKGLRMIREKKAYIGTFPAHRYFEVSIKDNLDGEIVAIFDLRRCVNDRPGLKGIQKLIGPRRR